MFKGKKIGITKVKMGKNVKIYNPCNIYECEICDDVKIGPFVEIQKDVFIGKKTIISSHSFICEKSNIGNNCFIGHGVMFINDLFKNGKLGGSKDKWFDTLIKDNVLIGSNATILPVQIAEGIVIGAGSVVTKNLNIKGIYAGNPARLIRKID